MAKRKTRKQIIKDEAAPARLRWANRNLICWVCGWLPHDEWPHGSWLPQLHTHEMAPCSQSIHAWCVENYFMTCSYCHMETIPGMTIEEQLALKRFYDLTNYDVEAVRALLTRKYILQRAEDADDEDKRQGLISIEEHYQRFINEKGLRK